MCCTCCREQQFSAADEYETAEEYAQRIWEEMQGRRQAQRDAEMAAFRRRRWVGVGVPAVLGQRRAGLLRVRAAPVL